MALSRLERKEKLRNRGLQKKGLVLAFSFANFLLTLCHYVSVNIREFCVRAERVFAQGVPFSVPTLVSVSASSVFVWLDDFFATFPLSTLPVFF